MPSTQIFLATEEDLKELLEIQHLSFMSEAQNMNNYDIQPIKETLDELRVRFNKSTIFKLVSDGKIIGSIAGTLNGDTCHIGKLFVHPDYRGNGYSNDLISYLFNYFSDVQFFEVYTSAESELNLYFYNKHGFKEIKRDYIDGSEFVYFKK